MSCRCDMCMRVFGSDSELALMKDEDEWFKGCPVCGTDEYLMDLEEEE